MLLDWKDFNVKFYSGMILVVNSKVRQHI